MVRHKTQHRAFSATRPIKKGQVQHLPFPLPITTRFPPGLLRSGFPLYRAGLGPALALSVSATFDVDGLAAHDIDPGAIRFLKERRGSDKKSVSGWDHSLKGDHQRPPIRRGHRDLRLNHLTSYRQPDPVARLEHQEIVKPHARSASPFRQCQDWCSRDYPRR